MDSLEGMAPQGGMELRALPDPPDLLDPLDPKVGGPSTPGGERPPAPKFKALRWSTLASLEECSMLLKVAELTISVCPKFLSIALTSTTELLLMMMLSFTAQSMGYQHKEYMTMMYHVLCATCLPDPLSS